LSHQLIAAAVFGSGAAAELMLDELPDGVDLRELGTRQLKDLSRPERDLAGRGGVPGRAAGPPAAQPGRLAALRAAHADPDRVVEVLRTAAGDGRLTTDDLDERLEAALTARTLADLEPLLADLATAAAAEVPDLARIECGSGSANRDKSWVVPRRLEIAVGSSSVRLYFRQAVIGRVGSGSVSARPARRRGRWRALWRGVLRRLVGNSRPGIARLAAMTEPPPWLECGGVEPGLPRARSRRSSPT
jgi:Domain of unknown function (DUF1707)